MNHMMPAPLARAAVERVALSALPDAPVVPVDVRPTRSKPRSARARQALAGLLLEVADRIAPVTVSTGDRRLRHS